MREKEVPSSVVGSSAASEGEKGTVVAVVLALVEEGGLNPVIPHSRGGRTFWQCLGMPTPMTDC